MKHKICLNPKESTITIRIESGLKNDLASIAAEKGVGMAVVVRNALKEMTRENIELCQKRRQLQFELHQN